MSQQAERPEPLSRLGLVEVYRPYFAGEARSIGLQAVAAFLGGMAEAVLLVVIARLAFSIGGDASPSVGLGPLDQVHIGIDALFILAVVLGLARFLMQTASAQLGSSQAARLTVRLRAETFHDYALASWAAQSEIDEAAVQDLVIRRVARVAAAIVVVSGSFTIAFGLLALLISAVTIDPLSALLVVGTGAFLFVALRPLSQLAKRYSGRQVTAGLKFASESLEAITVSLEIRAFGVSNEVAERLDRSTREESRAIYLTTFLARFLGAAYQLAAVAIVLVGLYVVYEFLDRPLASLSAIVVILVRSMNLASSLQGSYHAAAESAPYAETLSADRAALQASVAPSGDQPTPRHPALAFEAVSYRYQTDVEAPPALDDVSFEVAPGEAIGIIGPSGSGKSTLIQVVLRLRQPTSGRYLVAGVDAAELQDDAWFEEIAFVPQDCRVITASIRENIRFFRAGLTDEAVEEAAKRAHVHDEIMAMADGYDTVLTNRGGGLSGGQRQRVALARALASTPSILVLDEPTSALDMRSEALVHETLTKLQGSVTLLIIAHRLSTLKTCDRIMVFGEGRLQAFGDRAELDAENEFYRSAIELSRLRS